MRRGNLLVLLVFAKCAFDPEFGTVIQKDSLRVFELFLSHSFSEQESFERWETKLHLTRAHFAIKTAPGCDPFPAARRHVGCRMRGVAPPPPHINANSSIF